MTIRITPVQSRSLATFQRIEDSARKVIAQKGRDEFTTQQVADHAGVAIGTVYRFFSTRTALLDHLAPNRPLGIEESTEVSKDLLVAALRDAYAALTDVKEQNPRERVRQARASIESLGIDL